jgi:vancomycin resistance protein VanJ
MTPQTTRRAVARLSIAAVGAIALLEWIVAITAPEGGLLGVVQIFAPHLAIAGLALIPIALIDRRPVAGWASLALLVVTIMRFSSDWVSLPAAAASADSTRVEVVTWNLEVGSRSAAASVAVLASTTADVIGLQELQPETARAIEADAGLRKRLPYRDLEARNSVVGLGLLSRFPIIASTFGLDPAVQEATLDLGGGRRLAIVHAHPFHAEIASLGASSIPVGLDVIQRNADLDRLRALVDAQIADGVEVLLIGDLNTAASEPAFDRLVDGLRDVHAQVGLGTGWTWRPFRPEFLGLALLRIDHVITSPDIAPIAIDETCPAAGDHCVVKATVAIPPDR